MSIKSELTFEHYNISRFIFDKDESFENEGLELNLKFSARAMRRELLY